MKIEAGKYYRTRDGRKVGPMIWNHYGWWRGDEAGGENARCFTVDGKHDFGYRGLDLISEWTSESVSESPIRTVTRKEILPGTYGRIVVGKTYTVQDCNSPDDKPMPMVDLWAHERGYTASELRAAAATLIELADALENP